MGGRGKEVGTGEGRAVRQAGSVKTMRLRCHSRRKWHLWPEGGWSRGRGEERAITPTLFYHQGNIVSDAIFMFFRIINMPSDRMRLQSGKIFCPLFFSPFYFPSHSVTLREIYMHL